MTLDEYENYIIKGFAEELGLPYNKVSCTVREHHISELPKILSEGEIKPKSRDRLRLLYQAYGSIRGLKYEAECFFKVKVD